MPVTDVESLIAQVWNPDTRPLAEEAWRCYNSGAIRASIAATWTAVTADIIAKVIRLADNGDSGAIKFRTDIMSAQEKGITPDGVRAMQNIEASLLSRAVDFELIDSIGQRELERIREDRNLCVHPSLRSFSEFYEPRPEVARGHLAVALATLLTHPATQGGKILDAFLDYTCDPSFVPVVSHIQTNFFDRVRKAARSNIAKLAAKHALRELDPNGRLAAMEYANRSAIVLFAFAQRDRGLVRSAIAGQRENFQTLDGETQLRALIRLCDQDFFWEMVDEPLCERLQGLLTRRITAAAWEPLRADIAASLAVVSSSYARERIPALEEHFATLPDLHRMNVVATRPHPYFVPTVLRFIEEARSWRTGEQAGQLLLQHGAFLGIDDLRTALTTWAGNHECRTAAQMPDLAVALFRYTAHLGLAQPAEFVSFLSNVQSMAEEGDSFYRYPGLEAALRAGGHIR
ncbi:MULTISPECIES: hypothetical protein [unclassified Streptomyces]|uniref:hypothetical protein n=1 Tax=unclassified Streptomyces TaxID=2593676 RepID=UPI000978DEB8|nr:MULTISPECIES: hypothetical protein [unclassified Streptomyces]RDV49125.1 hypothetical protein DDV98_25625 [Streptomyces sp. IB2014 011-12]